MTTAKERRAAEARPLATEEQDAAARGAQLAPDGSGGELVLLKPETAVERFSREPVISRIEPKTFALIKRTVGVNCTDDEIGLFLELCAHYDLDWAAKEAWIAKGKSRDGDEGRLLIMVGRDGLRKIAGRNGIELEGDVVRAKDEFEAIYLATASDAERIGMSRGDWEHRGGGAPFHHVRHLQRGVGEQRGAITGSWARAYDRRTRVERGWFAAPLSEYKPKNLNARSVWAKQESVMALAAAERQAARQATPLGGLFVEGEDESINSTAVDVTGELDAGLDLPVPVLDVVGRAQRLGYAALADVGTVSMVVGGQPEGAVASWVEQSTGELDRFEAFVAEQRAGRREEVGRELAEAREVGDEEKVAELEAALDALADGEPEGGEPADATVVDEGER